MPALPNAYDDIDKRSAKEARAKDDEKMYSHLCNHHNLPELKRDQEVRVQNPKTGSWDMKGVIQGQRHSMKSYEILLDGKTKVRNRRHIRPVHKAQNTKCQSPCDEDMLRRSPRFRDKEKSLRRSPRLQAKKNQL